MHYAKLIVDRRVNGGRPDGNACHALLPIKVTEPGVTIQIVQCSFLGEGAGYSLIRISDRSGTHGSKITMNTTASLMGEYTITKISNTQYLATVLNNNCRMAQIIAESGVFLSSATPLNDVLAEWTIVAPNSTMISRLVDRLKYYGYGVVKSQSTNIDIESTLTNRQSDVLQYAFDHGYYDVPKGINVEDLAQVFDCSKSTLSVILRSAEKKIITQYMTLNRTGEKFS